MKRSLLLILFIAVVAMLAAELVVDIPFDTEVVGEEPREMTTHVSPFFHITNNGPEGVYQIDLVPVDLPDGWQAMWCNEGLAPTVPDGCHHYASPAWEFTFPAGATISLDLQAMYNTTGYFYVDYVITSDDLAEPLVLPFLFRTAEAVSNDDDVQGALKPGLLANYPNPFNPTTTISYNLTKAQADNAKIEIFNIRGELVKEFRNLTVNNNTGSVVWTADNAASGVYYYKLTSGSITDTKKMLMVK